MGSQFKFTYFILQAPNCESGGEYGLSIHKIRAHKHLDDPPNRSLDSYGLDKDLATPLLYLPWIAGSYMEKGHPRATGHIFSSLIIDSLK